MKAIPQQQNKLTIREVNFNGAKIGGDMSVSFMREFGNETKNFFALEIPYIVEEGLPEILKKNMAR